MANVCQLLAQLWLRELDDEVLGQLRQTQVMETFIAAGGVAPVASIETLAIEFCRLFIGPRDHLPPYQSIWERGEFSGAAAASVEAFADAVGHLASYSIHTMSDHFGIQLGVMSSIVRCHAHVDAAEEQMVTELHAMEHEFFRRHLRWSTRFLDAVAERTELGFYRGLAQMTKQFLASGGWGQV